MSTVSARFALKEKRKGKITKNGLTWLTSTPSNPYRSKAEACQPEPVIFAAWQGRGNDLSPRTPASGTGVGRGSAPLIFRNVPIREEEEFLFSSLYRGEWVVPGLRYPHRPLPPHDHVFAMQHKQPGGVDTPPGYCE